MYQWYSSVFPTCSQKERYKGGGTRKSPDFEPFALEIWPKNTTNFPAAFGGQKERYKGGGGGNPRNTTDVGVQRNLVLGKWSSYIDILFTINIRMLLRCLRDLYLGYAVTFPLRNENPDLRVPVPIWWVKIYLCQEETSEMSFSWIIIHFFKIVIEPNCFF